MRHRMRAWLEPDGTYHIWSVNKDDTYNHRRQIKEHGGVWNPEKKRWTVPESALEPLGIPRMMLVHVKCSAKDSYETYTITPEPVREGSRIKDGSCWACLGESDSIVLRVIAIYDKTIHSLTRPGTKPWQYQPSLNPNDTLTEQERRSIAQITAIVEA